VFDERGVILLDASDAELHQIAAPLFVGAIEQSAELDDKLLARGQQLESAGYHQQVKVTTSSTPLFMYRNGARIPVRRKAGDGGQDFVVGDEKFSRAELVEHARTKPEGFSPNVLLRPIIQDYLLPTLVYTGGSAEVAYFAQLAVVYETLAGRVTPILPRFSATILEPKMTRLLEKYDIELPALFQGLDVLREQLAQRTLPADLQKVFATAQASLDESLAAIEQSLGRLDKTLVEAGQRSGSKMKHQLEEMRARAARSAALRNDLISRHAEQLSEALYPNKVLQEREVGGAYFLSRYGRELLHDLYSTMHTDCHDHQVITLE
jgi:bacillithiol biosynthesis cysteine-adding enzyme BshC